MDNFCFYLEMGGSDVDLMHGMFAAHGMANGSKGPIAVTYPRGQQWFETDTVMRLIPDATPKRVEYVIATSLGNAGGVHVAGSTHLNPDIYVITDRTGLTLNINFKDKHMTLVHDNHVHSSSIKLTFIYEG